MSRHIDEFGRVCLSGGEVAELRRGFYKEYNGDTSNKDVCKYCGHGHSDLDIRFFDSLNVCTCPCHWNKIIYDKMMEVINDIYKNGYEER